MKEKFDELTKGLAQSGNRRVAFKWFGRTLIGLVLTTLGLARKAEAANLHCVKWACLPNGDYSEQYYCSNLKPPTPNRCYKRLGHVDCSYCNASGRVVADQHPIGEPSSHLL